MVMSVPSGPKGTRDFYPEQMAFQEYLFSSWKKTCKRYGFEPYEAPMFEHLDVYTQKSGAEIEQQLYAFEDKGGRMIALRPEMTPSLARMVAAKGSALKRPVRWYSIPRLFRYEKMQKGRLREFFQINMDILGSSEVTADAELIAAVIDMMRDLGLSVNDFQVRISSRTLLEECFTALGLSNECIAPLYALLDRKNKISNEVYQADLQNIIPDANLCAKVNALFKVQSLDEILQITGATPAHGILQTLFELLSRYQMAQFVCFDIGIVRGLAYYTGTVFEVFALGTTMRAIAGGGRYDRLVELYGGPPTPAVGFAAGDVVLGDLLIEKGLQPPSHSRCTVFIVAVDASGYEDMISLAQQLRAAGISCEFPLKLISIGKQLKQADATGAKITLFCGGNEAAQNTLKIKRMSDGVEQMISRSNAAKGVLEFLGGK
jgi:histidyl-tRNA synthetase